MTKQSIYGFQGAAHMLGQSGAQFAAEVRAAGKIWYGETLTLSFRSTRPVLDAVDAVFADPARTPGVTRSPHSLAHRPERVGHAGLVEVWDPEQAAQEPASDVFSTYTAPPAASPVIRLAARIADQIDHWLKSGEQLESRGRPIRARRHPLSSCAAARALRAR